MIRVFFICAMLCGILMGCGQSVSKDSLLEDYDYDGLPIWNVSPSMSTIPSFCASVEQADSAIIAAIITTCFIILQSSFRS